MQERIICPFSVIGNELKSDEDINELFIAGYRDKVCSDYTHSICIDDIKETINFENPSDVQIAWMQDVRMHDDLSLGNAVMQYMIDNITDLTINTLILFMQSAAMPPETIDVFVSDLHGKDSIRHIITDILNETDLPISRSYPEIAQFQVLDIAMSSIFAKVVSMVFEEFIDKIMSVITNSTGIERFYDVIYRKVYDGETVPASYSTMYNLCVSVLREILDQHTVMFREGLMLICTNVTSIVNGSLKFGQQISNPEYITNPNELIDSGLFHKDAFKQLNGEIKNDIN